LPSLAHCPCWLIAIAHSLPPLAYCHRSLTAPAGLLPSLAHCHRWLTAIAYSLPPLAHCHRSLIALAGSLPSLAHCPRWLIALAGSLPSLAHCPCWLIALAGLLPSDYHHWLPLLFLNLEESASDAGIRHSQRSQLKVIEIALYVRRSVKHVSPRCLSVRSATVSLHRAAIYPCQVSSSNVQYPGQ
jgi:hypothetical protein